MESNTTVCGVCQSSILSMDFANENMGTEAPHHLSLESLRRSMEAGCHICTTFWALHSSKLRKPSDDADIEWDSAFQPKELSRRTDSESTFSIAKQWIDRCFNEHKKCNPPLQKDAARFPTRLLDCGHPDDPAALVRLVISAEQTIREPFMTLSHCWGSADCLVLTTDNIDAFRREIPTEQLPQLYRDAISTTRRLGVRYLWIDSLCIIQRGDEKADWLVESTLMDQVYSNSYCNIAAVDAPDANHSLFATRNTKAFTPQIVQGTYDGSVGEYKVSAFQGFMQHLNDSAINSRGWVFQERTLSPRVLYFGEWQIAWECCSRQTTEGFESFDNHEAYSNVVTFHLMEPDTAGYRLSWWNFVDKYSTCALTFPQDRLLAMSAIAKRIRAFTGDEYVAGLWRSTLEQDLMWRTVREREAPETFTSSAKREEDAARSSYIAPSWSWAGPKKGTSRVVRHRYIDLDSTDALCNVHDVHLEYVTGDTTGLLKSGYLRLWGQLRRVELLRTGPFSEDKWMKVYKWKIYIGGELVETMSPIEVYLDSPTTTAFDGQDTATTRYYLPTFKSTSPWTLWMLLLEVHNSQKGIYRRIGTMKVSKYSWKDVNEMDPRFLAAQEDEDLLACEEYRDGKHLIRII
ncbi:heterokaryon incompatibility protein [Colletotrichum chrysophilum]|uniref:Heterokaryon incompatibility protein n=1 Tax=Colletotrichum chrysophilum TaxID=1836956 RepID=A0AAD9AC24_9PEZI|nr:heterokaryon incompatibility protein [Colletotrichum chrysophilum]